MGDARNQTVRIIGWIPFPNLLVILILRVIQPHLTNPLPTYLKDLVMKTPQCSQSVCSCESHFLTKLFEQNLLSNLNIPGYTHDPMYQHKTSYRPSGTFIWEEQCLRGPGEPTECCGFYPYRSPHKETPTQQCCGWSNDHVFNPKVDMCDADNEQVLNKKSGKKTKNDTTGKKNSNAVDMIKKALLNLVG